MAMNKRGSASAQLEDPEEIVETDQPGHAPEQEPTATPSPAQGDTPKPDPKAATPEEPDEGEDAIDPVAEMVDRLASDGPASDQAQGKTKAPAKPGDQPAAAAKESTGTAPKAGTSDQPDQLEPDAAEEDAVTRLLTPEQRKNTKGSVKEVIRAQERNHRSKLAEIEPSAKIGRAWDSLVQKHKLDDAFNVLEDTQIAFAIQSQASATRALTAIKAGKAPSAQDTKVVGDFLALAKDLGRHLGQPTGDVASLAAEFTGEIPQDLKDLKEVYGAIEDDEVKVLAAYRASKKPAGSKATAPATAPRAEAPASTAPAPRWSPEDVQLHGRQTAREIVEKAKIPGEQVDGFFTKNLAPRIVARLKEDFPDRDPVELFSQGLPPATRAKLVSEALADWEKASAQRSTPPRRPAPPPPIRTSGRQGSPLAASDADPVAELVDRLSSDRD